MHYLRQLLAAVVTAAALAAHADDRALLIQLANDGGFKVWHSEGASNLSDDELLELLASAKPEGGETVDTSAGPASAFDTARGVVVKLSRAKSDKALLIDRDNCGAVKAWHAEGTTTLSDGQLTELMLTALPGGGTRVPVGDKLAKAYTTELGVIALIWKPAARSEPDKALKPPSSAR